MPFNSSGVILYCFRNLQSRLIDNISFSCRFPTNCVFKQYWYMALNIHKDKDPCIYTRFPWKYSAVPYNAVNFLTNVHKRHPTARPLLGRGMWCLMWSSIWLIFCLSYSNYLCNILQYWTRYNSTMMTSSNGNIFRVTGHLCGEFTDQRWIPHTKASDAELRYFLASTSE